jgi:hypothetical protein
MDNNDNKTKYKMLKKIGEGTYGKAYLVEYAKTKVDHNLIQSKFM